MKDLKDFTTGSIPRLMVSFLIPLLLNHAMQAVYMLIDAMWAGKLLGSWGVAVVASGMPVVFLLSSLIAGIVIGASILAGHAFGSKNREMLSDIVSTSAIAAVSISIIISALGVLLCVPILKVINTPPSLFRGSHIFLSLIIGAMTFSALGQWFAAIMNAAGDSKTPFKVLVVSLVLNAVLAPVLITGAGILPPLGIAGSALSTIIANMAGALIFLIIWRSHHLAEIAPFKFKVHWNTLRKIVSIGFPLSLQMLIVSSSFIFILSLANRFGPDVTAAFGIGSRVDQVAFLAMFAVMAAVSAMTAQNVGARKFERIPEIVRWGIILSLSFGFFFFGIVSIFPDAITSLFTNDRTVINLTRHYFWVAGVSYVALAITLAYQGVLRGAGDTIPSFLIIASSMIFLRVPMCYYLSHYTFLKEVGLWAGITASTIVGACAFYFYYASGKWKERAAAPQRQVESITEVIVPETVNRED